MIRLQERWRSSVTVQVSSMKELMANIPTPTRLYCDDIQMLRVLKPHGDPTWNLVILFLGTECVETFSASRYPEWKEIHHEEKSGLRIVANDHVRKLDELTRRGTAFGLHQLYPTVNCDKSTWRYYRVYWNYLSPHFETTEEPADICLYFEGLNYFFLEISAMPSTSVTCLVVRWLNYEEISKRTTT